MSVLTVSATRTVDAPREELFAFLDEPPNQVRVAPSLTGVADVRPTESNGKRLVYGYGVFGLVFTGTLETSVYRPPERIVFQMDGEISGEIDWQLVALDDGRTEFTYAAEYDLSSLPGAGLFRPAFAWYNRRELRQTVENVRHAVETGETERSDYQCAWRDAPAFVPPRSDDHATTGSETGADEHTPSEARSGSEETRTTDETLVADGDRDASDGAEPTVE